MDNLTHSLIGLAAAKAGLEKLSPGTTTLCILAANAPDADTVVLIFGGRWEFLQHHRGITHSIVGALAFAVALPLVSYLGDLLIARARHHSPRIKLKGLILASLLVTATHPVMDWTNNYGMRFLLPWSPRWSYGDFVFIVDPFIWMVLGGAAFLLTSKTRNPVILWCIVGLLATLIVLFGTRGIVSVPHQIILLLLWIGALVVLITLYRRRIVERYGANVAIAALLTVTIYCAGLATMHVLALRGAELQATTIANGNSEKVIRVAAMPTVANPTLWDCVMETDRATYKFKFSLLRSPTGSVTTAASAKVIRYEKPDGLDAQLVAEAARDGRAGIFLGFARFPVVRIAGEDCVTQTLVQFADLRYTEPGNARGTFALDVPVACPALDERSK